MNCNNCGKTIDTESNYCKFCGYNLNPLATNQHSTIFDSSYYAHPKSNTDLGFLIILLIIAFNIFLWALWSFIGNHSESGYRTSVIGLRIIGAVSLVAQLIVMFNFTKKQNYRIIIIITGVLIILYQIHTLLQTWTAVI